MNKSEGASPRFYCAGSCGIIKISTRRFFARPSAVALDAIGLNSPYPFALNSCGSNFVFSSNSFIKLTARMTLNSQFEANFALLIGTLSVCPLMTMLRGGFMTSKFDIFLATSRYCGLISALPESNNTSLAMVTSSPSSVMATDNLPLN